MGGLETTPAFQIIDQLLMGLEDAAAKTGVMLGNICKTPELKEIAVERRDDLNIIVGRWSIKT